MFILKSISCFLINSNICLQAKQVQYNINYIFKTILKFKFQNQCNEMIVIAFILIN